MHLPTPNSDGAPEPVNFEDRLLKEKTEIHSAKAHRCVDKVRAKGHAESNSWAICTSSIGKGGVYAKGHGGKASPKKKVHEADLREFNDCHTPSGPGGGQFCSKGGAARRAVEDRMRQRPWGKSYPRPRRFPPETGFVKGRSEGPIPSIRTAYERARELYRDLSSSERTEAKDFGRGDEWRYNLPRSVQRGGYGKILPQRYAEVYDRVKFWRSEESLRADGIPPPETFYRKKNAGLKALQREEHYNPLWDEKRGWRVDRHSKAFKRSPRGRLAKHRGEM